MPISDKNIVARVVVPRDVKKQAEQIARKNGRSFSNWVCNLIRQELGKDKERK